MAEISCVFTNLVKFYNFSSDSAFDEMDIRKEQKTGFSSNQKRPLTNLELRRKFWSRFLGHEFNKFHRKKNSCMGYSAQYRPKNQYGLSKFSENNIDYDMNSMGGLTRQSITKQNTYSE
ncbi:hypothetical protein JCM33374_g5665 [Metschnikowia sp. JCM 33374]|nr:hypothetical protein JCM33374_g5665 [Metschnikowia sp. JCM 33374]